MMKKHIIPLVVSAFFCVGMTTTVARQAVAKEEKDMEQSEVVIEDEAPRVEKKISLSFPGDGQVIDILRPNVVRYIDAMHEQAKAIENDYVLHEFYARATTDGPNYGEVYENDTDKIKISDYASTNGESRSKSVTLVFDHKGFPEGSVFTVVVEKPGYDWEREFWEYQTTEKYVTVQNLEANKEYNWYVKSGDVETAPRMFKTSEGFRMITANGIQNIRDMGGRPVSGGKHIKQGVIFRGGELVNETYTDADSGSTHYQTLTEENKKILREDLGIKYEIDFRGDAEANNITKSELYDENHADIEYMRIPNLAAYDYFFEKSKSKTEFWSQVKDMFLAFKNANNKPVYFHCWGGADRTGTIGFMLGGLLGMSLTDLIIDYELTSFAGNYRPHNINDAKKVYRFPSMLYELFQGEHVSPFRAEGKEIKDIIADFLIDYAGLTEQDITDIRSNLLV